MVHQTFIKAATLAAIAGASLLSATANAAGFYDNLEGAAPAGFARTSGATNGTSGFSTTGEPALDARSYEFAMADALNGYSRISWNSGTDVIGSLRQVTVDFQAYIDQTSQTELTPYVLLGVDTNRNGMYDSATDALVIQLTSKIAGTPAKGQWLSEGLDQTSGVHVQVDRTGLAATGDNNFQPDGTNDYFSELLDTNYDSTTLWGDLNVHFVRVAAGQWNNPGQSYLGYVDNVNVQAVPEPATLAALGLGAAAVLRRRRKNSA